MIQAPMGSGWNDPAAIPPPGMFNQQRAGVLVNTHTALQVDSVFTALRILSNAIIKMGNPRAFTWGYDYQNRPYHQWLNPQPRFCTNTYGNNFQYVGTTQTVTSLALFGEAFWATLHRDELGYTDAVEVLNPALVEVKPPDKRLGTKTITYWYGSGKDKVQIQNEDMTHIPFMSMPGAMRGLSSIEYAGVAYALALAAMEYGQRWFAQGAAPSYLLSSEQKLGEPEVKRIAEKFLIDHSGLQAAHLPLVVDGGMKVQKIQSTPDEAQFLGTLEYARTVLAAWFGIPAHLMGGTADKGNVWGKTVQEQGIQMNDFTFSGYTVRLEQAISSHLPSGEEVDFDEELIQRANAADLAALTLAERTATVKTIDDIRVERYKLPPVDGGDKIDAPLASNMAPDATDAISSATHDDKAATRRTDEDTRIGSLPDHG